MGVFAVSEAESMTFMAGSSTAGRLAGTYAVAEGLYGETTIRQRRVC